MITENYVSFEIARLLKEKGFDEKCHSAWLYNPRKDNSEYFVEYLAKGTENNTELEYFNEKDTNWAYSAPTLQMAMKWLRNIRKLCIVIEPKVTDDDGSAGCLWCFSISKFLKSQYESKFIYELYEQACEAAIKYCLTNLV